MENVQVKPVISFKELEKLGVRVGKSEGPTEIEGMQAPFVLNLEPKEMMGVLSGGMLFDIGYADGITPVLAVPEKEVPNGTRMG